MTPRAGPFLPPGAWLAGFTKRTKTHCYIQNMKALGLVVLEKKIFFCFSHDAHGTGPVWTLGACLAGFIKRTSIHCYTVLLHLQTFFKNFVCAQFSFARRNVYHLRTVLVLRVCACFLRLFHGQLLVFYYISTVTPVHRHAGGRVQTGLHSHLQVIFFFAFSLTYQHFATLCFVHLAPSRTVCILFQVFNSHIHHRLCIECHLSNEMTNKDYSLDWK